MGKRLPVLLLLSGLALLLYPFLSQHLTTAAQHHAVAAYTAAEGETDLIGYLTIPSLDLSLPIRFGTSEDVLRAGVGLLEGTDPPSSEPGCHTVLSAHRGLPEARLFTDLDDLQPGDLFSVTVTDLTLTYQVVQAMTVSPEDTRYLQPEAGQNLCTLLTCTPYGINTHRLLVRGQLTDRIP